MRADVDTLIDGPLFRGLDRELVSAVLDFGRPRSFAVLQPLMGQGEVATSMHVILRGRVRVVHHTEEGMSVPLAELGPGEGVGEMGLIDTRPRLATVVAIEPTETVEIDADAFTQLSRRFPHFHALLARVLSQRLRNVTQGLLDRGPQGVVPPEHVPETTRPPRQRPEENRALIARCRELVVRQDWAGLEHIVSPEFSWFGLSGARGMREGWRRIAEHMGDVTTTIRQVIAEGDWVVELTTATRVRPDREPGAAVAARQAETTVSVPVVYLHRVENGKIAETIRVAEDLGRAAEGPRGT